MSSLKLAKGYNCLFPILLAFIIVTGTGVFYSRIFLIGNKVFDLSFISVNYKSCEDIVPNISMSKFFDGANPDFQMAVKKSTASEVVEGFSGEVDGQYKTMHYLAGQRHVKTVCETGFNLGHSSFNYLTANDQLIVHSFDLGQHKYASIMSEYMKKKFPGRFFIHFGDSTKTIPKFIQENPNFKCDLIFVDGGHVYPVALADIRNFAMIANLEENVILFDDYPTNWGQSFGKAWDDVAKTGVIKEKMRCTFTSHNLKRGFTIGRVITKPT